MHDAVLQARPAEHSRIDSCPTVKRVVTGVALQSVIATHAIKNVVEIIADDLIVAVAGDGVLDHCAGRDGKKADARKRRGRSAVEIKNHVTVHRRGIDPV